MDIVSRYRKVSFTVLAVDSIPCSLVGNKMIFSAAGELETAPWKLPWAMPWIERELRKLAKEKAGVSGVETVKVHNPEEPDQYLLVKVERYIDLKVGELIDRAAELYPDQEALIRYDGRIRYRYRG